MTTEPIHHITRTNGSNGGAGTTLRIKRHFTQSGEDPLARVEYARRSSKITNPDGSTVFELKDVRVPEDWSQLATDIIVSKYFRKGGVPGTGHETSAQQVVYRVAHTIRAHGEKTGYFADAAEADTFEAELSFMLIHQYGAFNSPVWFNVGLFHEYGVVNQGETFRFDPATRTVNIVPNSYEFPQSSACFIQPVEDDLMSIFELVKNEARVFKYGSGTGTCFDKIRGKQEKLSGGGTSSGLMSWLKVLDAGAGSIKSGGTCLAPYQRVYTATGPVAVEDLAKRESFVAMSYDPPAGRYKAKRARAWLAGLKNVVRVVTDKGTFDVTDDHPVKLSTGEYVHAGKLRAGHSLFACAIDMQHGHLRVHLRDGRKGKEFLHRLVASDVMGLDIEGLSVHHKDGNRHNNEPSNLETMAQAEHAREHSLDRVAEGTHIFQTERFPKSGDANGMHAASPFWQDEQKVAAYREVQGDILAKSGRAPIMQEYAAEQKMLNRAFKVLNAGYAIDTFDQYVMALPKVIGRVDSKEGLRRRIVNRFGSYENFVKAVAANNHRVVSVEPVGTLPVYDVEVECPTADDKSPSTGHNFVLWASDDLTGSGVVVANTRRAATMRVLSMDHPEIVEFIQWKSHEEKKARALIAQGYAADFNGEAYQTVSGQNSNNSVRVSDEFMRAVVEDRDWNLTARTTGEVVQTYKARELWDQIAVAAWECADPGVQYDTTINDWHTVPHAGRINASNPCCFVGETLVDTSEGKLAFEALEAMSRAGAALPYAYAFDLQTSLPVLRPIRKVWVAGHTTRLVEVRTQRGVTLRCTPEHRFLTRTGEYVEAKDLTPGTRLRKIGRVANEARAGRRQLHHRVTETATNGTVWENRFVWEQANGPIPEGFHVHHRNEDPTDDRLSNLELRDGADHIAEHSTGANNPRFLDVDSRALVETWEAIEFELRQEATRQQAVLTRIRGLRAEGLSYAQVAARLDEEALRPPRATSWSASTVHSVLKFGAETALTVTPMRWNAFVETQGLKGIVPLANGRGIQGKTWDEFSAWVETARDSVNDRVASVTEIELPEVVPVYDLEVEGVHNFGVTSPGATSLHSVVVHNSEFVHLDDTACNLSSLNLTKFLRADGSFDVAAYRHAVRIFFIAQEILVGLSSYPTPKIAEQSYKFRPLGLGFANLGTLLMTLGMPYDSDAGREYAACLTAIMHCHAGRVSAEMAARLGPFEGYADNREPMLDVMRKHRDAAMAIPAGRVPEALRSEVYADARDLVAYGELYGYRNSQFTLLAPTGTIGFLMDCDTTGIEPDFALVKHKKLAGGGAFKITNASVPKALSRLGYSELQIQKIITYMQGTQKFAGVLTAAMLQEKGLRDAEIQAAEDRLAGAFTLDMALGSKEVLARLAVPKGVSLLKHLGFSAAFIDTATKEILGHGTLEGAPGMDPEHLPVFACANRCGDGVQSIAPLAHLKMMAAVQPFLSGAISKTCNVPNEASIADIKDLYFQGWKLGLKAVAIYRDGCKASQPLNSTTDTASAAVKAPEDFELPEAQELVSKLQARHGMEVFAKASLPTKRQRLPKNRAGTTQEATIGGTKLFLRVGEYPDGRVGELFIDMHKEGAAFRAMANSFAIAVSIGLQYGVPLEDFVEQFTFVRFEPHGPVQDDAHIKHATSVLDYVFRHLGVNYLNREDLSHVKPISPMRFGGRALVMPGETARPAVVSMPPPAPSEMSSYDAQSSYSQSPELAASKKSGAPFCDSCGHQTVRNATCWRCLNCGTSMGCS